MLFNRGFFSQIRENIVRYFTKQTKLPPAINIDTLQSSFEDLSNDIIYEIFDFLDFCHAYEIFSNLNTRFENLLHDSTLPININLSSSISKSTFQRYHTKIILPNRHRIKSLYLSNIFINEFIFSSFSVILNFNQLEKLVLNNIESKYLNELLHHLVFLTCLISITIYCKYDVQEKNNYFQQLIRFPALKYCHITLEGYMESIDLPMATNEFSPIEYLIINGYFSPEDINILLSYLPELRRLSIDQLNKLDEKSIECYSTTLNYLTHVDLNIINVNFDEIELLIKNLFNKIQFLHISAHDSRTYLNAKQWERLITSYMPDLQIFDIEIVCTIHCKEYITRYDNLFKQFSSSFWFERQWFFGYHIYRDINPFFKSKEYYLIFYSTNPYRKKKYILCGERYDDFGGNNENNHIDSVNHLEIQDEEAIINCKKYFPNTCELTLCYWIENNDFLSTNLSCIVPLEQLTKLVIVRYDGPFSKIINLLSCTSNLHTFGIDTGSFTDKDIILFQENKQFQLISKTNNITKLNIMFECSPEKIEFLIYLCPRLHHITLIRVQDYLKSVVLFLLTKNNDKIRHLHSLSIETWCSSYFDEMESLLKTENFVDVSSVVVGQIIHSTMYLWW